uniref:potassium-transporting ATPase subunit C n=1 Tax=Fervidicoccus fontis TaxID=683846 RepID=UPI001D139379
MIAFLGLLYPALVWGISSLVSPWRAGGSLYTSCGKVISSDLISVYNESSPSSTRSLRIRRAWE